MREYSYSAVYSVQPITQLDFLVLLKIYLLQFKSNFATYSMLSAITTGGDETAKMMTEISINIQLLKKCA